MNIESNIICPECSSIPLLGINFNYENQNLSDSCELYSYCIFGHNKEKKIINQINFENIFLNSDKMIEERNIKIKCEFCKRKNINIIV